jgi:hypothetical protein
LINPTTNESINQSIKQQQQQQQKQQQQRTEVAQLIDRRATMWLQRDGGGRVGWQRRRPALCYEHVLGLHVEMHQLVSMYVSQRFRHL